MLGREVSVSGLFSFSNLGQTHPGLTSWDKDEGKKESPCRGLKTAIPSQTRRIMYAILVYLIPVRRSKYLISRIQFIAIVWLQFAARLGERMKGKWLTCFLASFALSHPGRLSIIEEPQNMLIDRLNVMKQLTDFRFWRCEFVKWLVGMFVDFLTPDFSRLAVHQRVFPTERRSNDFEGWEKCVDQMLTTKSLLFSRMKINYMMLSAT